MMQLTGQLNLSGDWEVAMTCIIYPYSSENVREHQLSYTLLPLDINHLSTQWYFCTVKDIIHGMYIIRAILDLIITRSGATCKG